jgi:hypothetical protein
MNKSNLSFAKKIKEALHSRKSFRYNKNHDAIDID